MHLLGTLITVLVVKLIKKDYRETLMEVEFKVFRDKFSGHMVIINGEDISFVPVLILKDTYFFYTIDYTVATCDRFTIPSGKSIDIVMGYRTFRYTTPVSVIHALVDKEYHLDTPIGTVEVKPLPIVKVAYRYCTYVIQLPFRDVRKVGNRTEIYDTVSRYIQSDIEQYVMFRMGKLNLEHMFIKSTIIDHYKKVYDDLVKLRVRVARYGINAVVSFNEDLEMRILLDTYSKELIDYIYDEFYKYLPRIGIIDKEFIENLVKSMVKV